MSISRRIPLRLRLVIVIGVLLVLFWFAAHLVLTSIVLSYELKLALLSLIALIFSLLALAGIDQFMQQRRYPGSGQVISIAVLLPAYLVPALVFIVPDWSGLSATNGTPGWQFSAAGQPWTFIWQGILLAGFGLSQRIRWAAPQAALQIAEAGGEQGLQTSGSFNLIVSPGMLVTALLSGLGLWLAGMFSFSLQGNWLDPGLPNALSPFLTRSLAVVALLVAPIGEEFFFRDSLMHAFTPRLKATVSVLLVTVLFATVQFRPLLWLPAFILGLGLAYLVQRTGRLYPAIIAHILFNALMLVLGWYMVI
jgi:membrane protease YdiL (CAAX protease family)